MKNTFSHYDRFTEELNLSLKNCKRNAGTASFGQGGTN